MTCCLGWWGWGDGFRAYREGPEAELLRVCADGLCAEGRGCRATSGQDQYLDHFREGYRAAFVAEARISPQGGAWRVDGDWPPHLQVGGPGGEEDERYV